MVGEFELQTTGFGVTPHGPLLGVEFFEGNNTKRFKTPIPYLQIFFGVSEKGGNSGRKTNCSMDFFDPLCRLPALAGLCHFSTRDKQSDIHHPDLRPGWS